jgi:ABC-type uncharacterized transport system permease subunit
VWRFDVAATLAATVARILAATIVWSAVFGERARVGGFTLDAMLSYYIVVSFLSALDFSHQLSGGVSELILTGRFSGHMTAPISPFGYFGARAAGESPSSWALPCGRRSCARSCSGSTSPLRRTRRVS